MAVQSRRVVAGVATLCALIVVAVFAGADSSTVSGSAPHGSAPHGSAPHGSLGQIRGSDASTGTAVRHRAPRGRAVSTGRAGGPVPAPAITAAPPIVKLVRRASGSRSPEQGDAAAAGPLATGPMGPSASLGMRATIDPGRRISIRLCRLLI